MNFPIQNLTTHVTKALQEFLIQNGLPDKDRHKKIWYECQ